MYSVDTRSQTNKQLSGINIFRRYTNNVRVMKKEFPNRKKLGNIWIIY